MILKKPYAFFIKIFKPMHIFVVVLTTYLIYISNNILVFFNEYIYSNQNVVGKDITENLVSNFLYIIPIIIIIFSLLFLGIMFNKKKPIAFYIVNIFIYLIVIIINLYVVNFLSAMEESIVSIKIVKLAHDLILINMIFEITSFIFFIVRGLGLNFTKFNFESDITKLNINEDDREEIELNFNIDVDTAKRKRKQKLRYFKYIYRENKFIINLFILFIVIGSLTTFLFFYFTKEDAIKEGVIYSMNNFNLKVNKSFFLNEDFNNQKITDNYLVIVEVSLQTNFRGVSLYLKDFSLEIEDAIFPVTNKYSDRFIDIGNVYNQEILPQDYTEYIFIFEIPQKYIESDLSFVYNNQGVKTKINLDPQNYISNKIIKLTQISDIMNFSDSLGDISFSIDSFEIKEKFLIKYNYCIKENDCVLSKEYIQPTINENFDKHILKLNVNYIDESNLQNKSFYEFFSKFGIIEYTIGDKTYSQRSNFEELKSKKINNKNNIYIGVNEKISIADSISLVFNIRNSKYVYILK